MTRQELYEKARLLPLTPGVYLMRNRAGTVIYVGKSKALRNRVSSYFAPYAQHYGKTEKMVSSVFDFEVYHTKTELEALLQENAFIKQYMPRYNIKLKEENAYPYIRVSSGPYPNLSLVYSRKSGHDRYFGPFSGAQVARSIISTAQKTFGLPACGREFPKDIGKGRPCLDYHIGQCCGLCMAGKVSERDYRSRVENAVRLLKGDYGGLVRALTDAMNAASEAEQYERAAAYRDCIRAVRKIGDRQQIVASPSAEADVIGVYADDLGSSVAILFVRNGAITDRETFFFGADELMDPQALEGLLQRYYELRGFIPKRICVSMEFPEEESALLTSWLREKAGFNVSLSTPKRGEMRALTERACKNAEELILHRRAEEAKHGRFLASFASFAGLDVVPDRIESYDVSHSGGDYVSCGMVVLEKGRFARRKYRSFNMRDGEGGDDAASLREALSRRFSHSEQENGWEYPDLILMDGGVAQVRAARDVLREKDLDGRIQVLGMVKDEHHKTRTLTDGENELSLTKRQDVFVFIYKIQEEVHRYALSRMDARRRNAVKHSSLTNVKGVGEARAQDLLRHFGTLEALRAASAEEIAKVRGINAETAARLAAYLKEGEKE
ncbi:MAG: excinuclease ABC subunit UvrC [Clostridia bacterium]|nr:excinuclease ABC subunit UvrC [Clostridia bacterium]